MEKRAVVKIRKKEARIAKIEKGTVVKVRNIEKRTGVKVSKKEVNDLRGFTAPFVKEFY